jgi:hypothetical protein
MQETTEETAMSEETDNMVPVAAAPGEQAWRFPAEHFKHSGRDQWGAGEWDNEPDKLQWTTAAGLPGLIVRNRSGALCGYAAVPPGHMLHGVDYGDTEAKLPDGVHGGLTYSGACSGVICHVPAPGEPDHVHWFGFDCSHAYDISPGTYAFWRMRGEAPILCEPESRYRDLAYVRREVESLAAQLAAVRP